MFFDRFKRWTLLSLYFMVTAIIFANGQPEAELPPQSVEVYAFAGPIKEEFWRTAIEEFNTRYPEVEVVLNAGPKINDQLRVNLAAGNPPDVYFSAGAGKIQIPQLVAEDLIIPLDELLASEDWNMNGPLIDSIIPGRIQKLNGSIYGIELPFHLVGFFYHEPTFVRNGWKVPEDFEDFMEIAPKISGAGIYPMVTTGVHTQYFERFVIRASVASAGGPQALLDWANLKPGFFTSAVFKDVVKKFEWIIQNDYLMPESVGLNHIASQSEWVHGKAAFVPSGTWIESEMKNDFPEDFEDGIRYLPSFMIDRGQKPVVAPFGEAPVTILRGDNEKEAKEFVRALYSPGVMAKLTEITNILTNVTEANQISSKSPAIASALDWFEKGDSVGWPAGGYATQDVSKAIQGNLQSLMIGSITADEFCISIEKVAEQVRNDKSITYFDAFIPQ